MFFEQSGSTSFGPFVPKTLASGNLLCLQTDYCLEEDQKNASATTIIIPISLRIIHELCCMFLSTQGSEGLNAAKAVSSGVRLCRDLVNSPSNILTPGSLADVAVQIAKEHGLEAEILEVH